MRSEETDDEKLKLSLIMKLRKKTGIGMCDSRNQLIKYDWDFDEAYKNWRKDIPRFKCS
jgi:translation elongation factor EF-Ts